MRITAWMLALSGAVWFWVPSRVLADELVLHPVADTTLLGLNPGNNFGAQEALIVGSVNRLDGEIRTRLLLRFDLSGLPPGAVIHGAALGVEVLLKRDQSPAAEVGAHRLLKSWGEGAQVGLQGAPAARGEATWISRFKDGEAWEEPGGKAGVDFVSVPSSVTSMDGPGRIVFESTPALIEDVRSWQANPALNFGWVLIGRRESVAASARRIASRESDLESARPSLILQYSVPETVPFESVGLDGSAVQLRFRAEAGNVYTVGYRPLLDGIGWETLTNVVSKFVPLDAVVVDVPESATRFYRLEITGRVD